MSVARTSTAQTAAAPELKQKNTPKPKISKAEAKLTARETAALKDLRLLYVVETKRCINLTGGRTLTDAELKQKEDDKEFKTLIEIPLKNKEPLYIMPEFDEKDAKQETLHPALKPIVEGIKAGRPYHEFMPKNYGEAWPILFRLYFGLKDGFKISIEQLQSMMKIPYWHADKQTTECVPILNSSQTGLSYYGQYLMREALQMSDEEIARFIALMKAHPEIPEGEKHVQVVRMDPIFTRSALQVLTKKHLMESEDAASSNMRVKFEFFDQRNVKTLGNYSYNANAQLLQSTKGALLFAELFGVNHGSGPGHVFIDDKGPFFVAAPATLLKHLNKFSHYQGQIRYVNRLGKFGPQEMEAHIDNGEHAGNLTAPGISNIEIAHGTVVSPATAVSHDDYHFLVQLLTSPDVNKQLLHLKNVLRSYFDNTKTKFVSEVYRSIEREVAQYVSNDDLRLYHLLRKIFRKEKKGDVDTFSFSSVILVTDMLLSPEHWTQVNLARKLIISNLMHFKNEKVDIEKLQKAAKSYARKAHNNHPFVSVLLLCRFYLDDQTFCNMLLHLKNPNEYFAWRKAESGALYPVMIFGAKELTFERLAKMSAEKRALLFLESMKNQETVTAKQPQKDATETAAKDTRSDAKDTNGHAKVQEHEATPVVCKRKVTVYVPGLTPQKRAIIEKLKGVVEDSKTDVHAVRLPSFMLDKSICKELGIERITLQIPTDMIIERLKSVESFKGLTAERLADELFQFTFPATLRKEVDAVIQKWNVVDAAPQQTVSASA
jgi:hypothetical protein